MKPANLNTRIFLDSGDPAETREAIRLLGWLDGQTTNPTLIAKNPEVKTKLDRGEKLSRPDADELYRNVVQEVSELIANGSVSIEVYADKTTTTEQMLLEGVEKFSWISNAHIKYPTTAAGLEAAHASVDRGMRVNMTLCFSQSQAAAVYAATAGAKRGDVFVSPFIGRLDDIGENGMELIQNIIQMYQNSDHRVETLTASVRSMNHLLEAIRLGSDIITAPLKILKEWADAGLPMPGGDFHYDVASFKAIPYQNLNLTQSWEAFDIGHPLTDKGIEKFAADWNAIIA